MRTRFLFLLLASCLCTSSASLAKEPQTEAEANAAAARAIAGLPRSSPERQGVSSAELLAFVDAADSQVDSMHSLMVVRHGHVVAECWWAPYDAATPHVLFSLSKSFASTAVGLAVAEGKLSLDDKVLDAFPGEAPAEPSANLRAMRVRDLLRMSAGHQVELNLWRRDPAAGPPPASLVRAFLEHPVPFKPGTHFLYNSPATFMCSAMVQKATGQATLDFLRPRLFEPLGFDDPHWLASPEGISLGAFGFFARTEEIARLGQLYLQRGAWQGRQLLPAAWVDEATALETSNGSNPASDWEQGYGYQFWRSRHGYRGDGAFGQYCLVLPEFDAVVAITSGVRDMQGQLNVVWDKLLPAFKSEALAEDEAARQRLQSKLAGCHLRLPAGEKTAAAAERASNVWYEFPENDRQIEAVRLELGDKPAIVVRQRGRERRTAIGQGAWARSAGESAFAAGIEGLLSVPADPVVAAAGAWPAGDVLQIKLAAYQTPFVATLSLKFEDDRLLFDCEHNVGFGPTRFAQLVGRAR